MRWRPKEPVNSYSHLFGVVLSVVGLATLIGRSADSPAHVVGFAVYGASLILLYSASTTYHWLDLAPRGDDVLRRFDHSAIFLLIAGSYTPICLVTLRGDWGELLFLVVWSLAFAGIALKVFAAHLPRGWTSALYLGMGWLAVIAIVPLTRNLPVGGLLWLFGGGLLYTLGAIVYATERPDPLPDVFGSHEIFHFFVLGGSALHFGFMLGYVVPLAAGS